VNFSYQDNVATSSFPKGDVQEMTMTSSFLAHTLQEKHLSLEVKNYHLIFDLNGVFIATNEDQTKICPVVLRPNLKEFLSACVNKFTVYIWSSTMKKNFSRHLEIIAKKIGTHLPSFKIVDQSFCFKNNHFLPKKPYKPVFHKNLFDFFVQFPCMTFENTLLIDDTPHKSLFNPPFNAIFLKMFYGLHNETITCSKPFFLIWNLYIFLECKFINL